MNKLAEELKKLAGKIPVPEVFGVMANEPDIDEEAVWEAAKRSYTREHERQERGAQQQIQFDHGPVCLVFMADLHCGGTGVDYGRIDADCDLILNTPGMYVGLVGDLLDNFIVGKLLALQKDRKFTVSEEWVLVRRVVSKLAPKLLFSVGGNHDAWTYMLSGVDYFREVQASIKHNVLYASDDLLVSVAVGTAVYRLRARHKWRGNSMYNPTHAIERAAKFDGGRPFDVGIGAHTHVSGVSRYFNNGGKTGLAVQCGSYKRYDEYATRLGFPAPNEAAAMSVILDSDGSMVAATTLQSAARFMVGVYE